MLCSLCCVHGARSYVARGNLVEQKRAAELGSKWELKVGIRIRKGTRVFDTSYRRPPSRYLLAAAATAVAVVAAGLLFVVVSRHTAGCLCTGNRRHYWQALRLPVLR